MMIVEKMKPEQGKTILLTLLLLFPLLLSAQSWSKTLPGVGTFSSPRVADFNQDGVKDLVLGAGRLEFQACDSAVIALDGKSGKMLWKVPAKDQIFGSAALHDLDGDGILDPVINGRSAELIAISGKKGKILWRFSAKDQGKAYPDKPWYNFYNPQFIPDQDGDGLEDILVSNGGDVMAEPYDENRPPGYLLVLSGSSGQILGLAEMPDGREIYMSINVMQRPDGSDHDIVFGTGGETIGGNLYLGTLSMVLEGDLSRAKLLDSSPDKGYIGPPVRVDLNGDDVPDVVTNSVNGRVLAFDGLSYDKIWEHLIPKTESYSSLAVGYFNADDTPDLFVSNAQGVWPELKWGWQEMLDGKTGEPQFIDSLGFYQNSTPLAVDVDNSGRDEILMSFNYQERDEIGFKYFYTTLLLIGFETNEVLQIGEVYQGSNLSSTPWIGDLDGDGYLDII
jgi:outer membrane protein assembly factor BamB